MKWTKEKQRRFDQLETERSALSVERSEAVSRVAEFFRRIDLSHGYVNSEALEAIISDADELRDALEPFDSGIRVATA